MLQIHRHGDVAELQMDRPPANALNNDLLAGLHDAFDDIVGSGARAVILSGRDGMFSGGIDVPELLSYDRAAIGEFWARFMHFNQRLAGSPVPVLAAIGGHAPAGGAVLALHCDYRVAAEGNFKIGLNEVRVGLPVPETILRALSRVVGAATAARLATCGTLMTVSDAAKIGLVDELVPAGQLRPRAIELLGELAVLPPVAMNTTRLAAKADFLASLDGAADADMAAATWFSEETLAAMRRLAESLGSR